MSSFKSRIKEISPEFLWRPLSNSYWWWRNRGRHQMAGFLSKELKASRKQIHNYRDNHRGQRCFIIGNGPSLRKTDLSLLEQEITFGLNRIYLIFPELGFQTTYLLSVNDLVIEQCAHEFKVLNIPKFFTWRSRRYLHNDPQVIFMDTDYTQPENFTLDMTGRIYEGCTVTYVAMQLAFYMGFETVYLIGVDHSFKTKGPPNKPVVSEGDDPNHFHPEYFGKGFVWQLPDYECSERAYQMAKDSYESDGRRILDATVGGKLRIFQKVDYLSLF